MDDGAPETRLVGLLLDPTRLRIVASLLAADEVDFGFVRDRVGLTDSALSKQLKGLAEAGLVRTRRERKGPARKAWVGLTAEGRAQVARHVEALREIASG